MSATAVLTSLAFSAFSLQNNQNVPSDSRNNLQSFTLSTRPVTDIWRKPSVTGSSRPQIDDINAPYFVGKVPLTGFRRAQVTLDAQWNRLYDQAGMVFIFPAPAPESTSKRQWIKTGIEMFNGIPNVATVCTPGHGSSDWSLLPLPDKTQVTIELVREGINETDGKGGSLLINMVEGEKRTMIRETTWVFEKEIGEVEIGVYVARPIKDETQPAGGLEEVLTVTFTKLDVQYLPVDPVTEPTQNPATTTTASTQKPAVETTTPTTTTAAKGGNGAMSYSGFKVAAAFAPFIAYAL